jgi:protein-tyrosine-phosphatase
LVDLLTESDLTVRELGEALNMPGNLLAHHLNVVDDAGIITRTQSEGDHRRRYVSLRREVLDGLMPQPARYARVAFVCSQNSARSQYAAAYWSKQSGRTSPSAGVHPALRVHPLAIRVAGERGIDLGAAEPRGYDSLPKSLAVVISVCDRAREGLLPEADRHIHWSIPDPVPRARLWAFRSAFDEIERRVDALFR